MDCVSVANPKVWGMGKPFMVKSKDSAGTLHLGSYILLINIQPTGVCRHFDFLTCLFLSDKILHIKVSKQPLCFIFWKEHHT
jgi:hypothetical protein